MGEPSLEEVKGFLDARHGRSVDRVELLQGGHWSAAYAYVVDGQELVVRFGQMREGYEMDRAAMRFGRHGCPVPDVLEVGEAFGGSFAISQRCHGTFLEDVSVDDAPVVVEHVDRLLAALRAAAGEPDGPASWFPPGVDAGTSTWRGWLVEGLSDDPDRAVTGWRARLAEDDQLEAVFSDAVERVEELVVACPERRDLVHGDLLHQNVLVAHDLSRINAVFSWKCSVFGDFLFDVAWLTFWSRWHPGIAAMQLFDRAVTATDLSKRDLVDAALRHHCYELQIGASHLGWFAWTDDADNLTATAGYLRAILDAGPRS